MSRNRRTRKATDPSKPIPTARADREQPEPADESVGFTEEKIHDEAVATTSLLSEMLERQEKLYRSRFWGINE